MLQWMKDQSKRRRLLLSEQLGVQESDQLCRVLGTEDERNQMNLDNRIPLSPANQATFASLSLASSRPTSSLNQANSASLLEHHRHHASPTTGLGYSSTDQKIMTQTSLANTSPEFEQHSLSDALIGRLFRKKVRRCLNEAESTSIGGGLSSIGNSNESNITANNSTNATYTPAPNQIKGAICDRASNKEEEDEDEDLILESSKYEYKGSSAFLKGTQSANPHNDYCQHYVDTGQRPQNFIRDYELHDRFEEYPKLKELISLKDELIAQTATPPMYLKCDMRQSPNLLRQLNCKFDVILIDPPLEEYQRTQGVTKTKFWSWENLMHLEIEEIAASRSFLFLWCGSSDGLDLGRQCLRKWGFRRCEDICWIKTNKKSIGHNKNLEPKAIFQRTKEHCLMGIKGTVRRSTDGDFIHSNVDIDLIISEQPAYGTYDKPEEIFHIIEHFCLGRRRLHLFGRDATIRPGWLTVGPELTNSNFNADLFKDYFTRNNADCLTGCTERIEALRPKSPPPKGGGGNINCNPMPAPGGNGPQMLHNPYSRKRF